MGRIIVWIVGGAIGLLILVSAVTLQMHTPASSEWIAFSIGPASGRSTAINPGRIRSDAVSIKTLLSVAYGMPAVRVIGPDWLGEARYSLHAEVSPDAHDSFRPLLQRELTSRLRLAAHTEQRPFDVFVLTATRAPHLVRAAGDDAHFNIHDRDMLAEQATLSGFAGVLQGVLGKPVIDETGIGGNYQFEFAWGENRVASVTEALLRRFGLVITAANRSMPALVVDSIQPDAALSLLTHVNRLTNGAPPAVRQRISSALSIH